MSVQFNLFLSHWWSRFVHIAVTWWSIWPKSCLHPAAVCLFFSLPLFPSPVQSLSFHSVWAVLLFSTCQKRKLLHFRFFLPVTETPQVWVTNELCDRSDADELLSRCFKGPLSLSSLRCRKEQYEGEMKPPSSGFIQFAISLFWYAQHCGFGVHQQGMSAGQFEMHLTDCSWLEQRVWVLPCGRLLPHIQSPTSGMSRWMSPPGFPAALA